MKNERERIHKRYQSDEARAFSQLADFARARRFRLSREQGQMVFTLLGPGGEPLTEADGAALGAPERAAIELAEQELRAEIVRFLEQTRPLERARDDALAQLLRQSAGPLVTHGLDDIRQGLRKQIKDAVKLGRWLDQVQREVLDDLELFVPHEGEQPDDPQEEERRDQLANLLALCQVNLAVDNASLKGAPVVVEDNPQLRNLFGHIQYESGEDAPYADFSSIHAGGLLRAHGGYLMLFLRDLLGDTPLWERLRRFLRCSRLAVEDTAASHGGGGPTVALQPEGVDVDVKLVRIGTAVEYYVLQEGDEDLAQRFRVKVDFAERFTASAQTHYASAVFIARACARRGLPHCSAAAVARLLEFTHREADDQSRQSARFSLLEALLLESAAQARARGAALTDAADVEAALIAKRQRHNAPEEALHESIAEGELLITLDGTRVGQLNALTQIDLGDYRFGFPVRITARTHAGQEGLVNIEREVELSGPIHDKGVLILHSYFSALFGHLAPLALNASIVLEQEYSGIEGDSASCAELYALLSSLSGLALRQDIAVTGALNQHGEVLPVGGLNEKIEGWYRVCAQAGLTGTQGVLIPARNQRHLMLSPQVVQAVADGQFHVHAAQHVSEGVALLTGHDAGLAPGECLPGSVHARAEATLLAYRRAWQAMALGRRLPQRGR